jgi:hypothetical protein
MSGSRQDTCQRDTSLQAPAAGFRAGTSWIAAVVHAQLTNNHTVQRCMRTSTMMSSCTVAPGPLLRPAERGLADAALVFVFANSTDS